VRYRTFHIRPSSINANAKVLHCQSGLAIAAIVRWSECDINESPSPQAWDAGGEGARQMRVGAESMMQFGGGISMAGHMSEARARSSGGGQERG
jgi:hypothetical protein